MRAGFYEADITPPIGCYMPGYYSRQIAEDVIERLYAKAAVLENEGELVAVVSVDTCFVPPEMHEIVTKRVYEYTGIEAEHVCICSNHTHRGAPVGDNPEINCFADAPYKDVFFRLAADAVILAYKRMKEVTVKFGTEEVTGISFNRNIVMQDGTLVTNWIEGAKCPLAGIDPTLSVVSFESEGKPVAAMISFACHQDCTDAIGGYTGDYSSILAQELKAAYGDRFVSVFVPGTCGDINHLSYEKKWPPFWYRQMGKIIAGKAQTAIANAAEISGDIAVIKETITIKRRVMDRKVAMDTLSNRYKNYTKGGYLFMARNLEYYLAVNQADSTELFVQGIQLGELCIYAMPGELFVNTGLAIKNCSPFKYNIIIENCNSYCGYIPTAECFCEESDLYETSLCFHSCHVPEAAQLLTEKALEISNKLMNR